MTVEMFDKQNRSMGIVKPWVTEAVPMYSEIEKYLETRPYMRGVRIIATDDSYIQVTV